MPKSQTKLSNIQTVTSILLVTSCNTMDSYCETYNNKDKKIDEICFCKDCNIFLCRPCHGIHKQVRSLQNHRILRGSMMPQTNTELFFPQYWQKSDKLTTNIEVGWLVLLLYVPSQQLWS